MNSQAVVIRARTRCCCGIHLAGPNLTPETFKEGLFRFPPERAAASRPRTCRGANGCGTEPDYNASDDATAIWWDPNADRRETRPAAEGTGMLRYVEGGKRYLPGDWPDEPIPFFEEEGSVTIYDARTRTPRRTTRRGPARRLQEADRT